MSASFLHTKLLDLSSATVEFAANWLLQSSLLLVVGLLTAIVLRGRGSAAQSVVYRTTLVAVLISPFVTLVLGLSGVTGWSFEMPAAWSVIDSGASVDGPVKSSDLSVAAATPVVPDVAEEGEAMTAHTRGLQDRSFEQPYSIDVPLEQSPAESEMATAAPAESTPPVATAPPAAEVPGIAVETFGLVAALLSVAWIVISGILLGRLAYAWWDVLRLRRRTVTADRETVALCQLVAVQLGVRAPTVLRSPYVPSPCLAGLFDPVILLPEEQIDLPLRDVLLHELAHLRRHDCQWKLVHRIATSLFFYQPLLWTLARRIEIASEEVCDDYVVHFGGDRRLYACGLVDVAELSTAPAAAVGAVGVGIVSLRSMLAHRVSRIMDTSRTLSTRMGNVSLALVLAGGMLGTLLAGVVGLEQTRADKLEGENGNGGAIVDSNDEQSEAALTPLVAATTPSGDDAKLPEASTQQAAQPPAETEIFGHVLGADGKPVVGAQFYWFRSLLYELEPMQPRLIATTDGDGRFRFTPPALGADEKMPHGWSMRPNLIVKAPGHGFLTTWPYGLRHAMSNEAAAAAKLGQESPGATVRLPAVGESIRGRLISIDGRPIQGAMVRARWFNDNLDRPVASSNANDPNSVWRARVDHLLGVIEPYSLRDVLPQATTDADGRFVLEDVGAGRMLQLLVEKVDLETTEILVHNVSAESIEVLPDEHSPGEKRTLFGHEFVQVVGPSKPLEGRVLDFDTAEPIVGAYVRAFALHGDRLHGMRGREEYATRTDAEGNYRLTGLPIGSENKVVAFTMGDLPYLPVGFTVDTSTRGDAAQQDFRLKQGVWAEGRVFDAETNQSFTGELSYYMFEYRTAGIPGIQHGHVDGLYWTNGRGEFRVPVLPLRGVLAYRYDGDSFDRNGIDRFPRGHGAEEIEGREAIGFPTAPFYLIPENYERVAEVRPQQGENVVRVDLPLVASPTVKIEIAGATDEISIYGANERFGWQTLKASDREVIDMKPGEARKVFAFDRTRNLAGGAVARYGQTQPVELALQPAGSVSGRIVDADGVPMTDVSLYANYEKLTSDQETAIWANGMNLVSNPTRIPVDAEGRFRLDGLIAGWKYSAWASAPRKMNGQVSDITLGSAFDDVIVAAGESKDLGDLVVGATEKVKNNPRAAERADASATTALEADADSPVLNYRGQVVDTDGRPIARAHVAVVAIKLARARGGEYPSRADVLAEGTTNADGRFEFEMSDASSNTHRYANVIARADGTSLAWEKLNLDADATHLLLTLKAEQVIRGRLVDIEGQAAADVEIVASSVVQKTQPGSFSNKGVGYGGERIPAAWIPTVRSDAEGRFAIHGVPGDHGVLLKITGSDRFAPQSIALNTGMAEQRPEHDATYRPLVTNIAPGDEALLPLAPAQIFEGVVRFEDTGEPAPYARVSIWASQQQFGSMLSVAGKADAEGHYRISPNPGIRFGVSAFPPDGTPYLARTTPLDKSIQWQAGDRVKRVDMTVPRGVVVSGRLLEAGTNAPVAGASIQYVAESENNRNGGDDILIGWQAVQLSDADGNYEIATLPGKGWIIVHAASNNYVIEETTERKLSANKPGGRRNYAHAFRSINPKRNQDPIELNIELRRGSTVTGTMVDEHGATIDEALVISGLKIHPFSLYWRGHSDPILGGRFELTGLEADQPYDVYFLDANRRLGASQKLRAGEESPTVVLRPCGEATVRYVDSEGKPVNNRPSPELILKPGAGLYDFEAARRGETAADGDLLGTIDQTNYMPGPEPDAEGRVVFPALIPGALYRLSGFSNGKYQLHKEFSVQSGQRLDLGEIVVERSTP